MGANRRIPAYALLALAALLAAAFLFSFPPSVHGQPATSVTFNPSTIANKTYTAGARVNQTFDATRGDQGLPKLPEVTLTNPPANTVAYTAAYAATGLPAGITMASDRVIRGIPEAATTSPANVTYTATVTAYVDPDADGVYDDLTTSTHTGTLSFTVTVNPAVTFGEEARKFINSRIIVWVSGQGWHDRESDGKITFPEATGGTGTLTYSLIDNDSGQPLSSVASGITFDTATRKLGGTPAQAARKTWAVTYAAVDTKGGRAAGSSTVYAGGWGVGGL